MVTAVFSLLFTFQYNAMPGSLSQLLPNPVYLRCLCNACQLITLMAVAEQCQVFTTYLVSTLIFSGHENRTTRQFHKALCIDQVLILYYYYY
jgi:hypothetical protein